MDNTFMGSSRKKYKALINNSYTNEKTCVSPVNFRKRQLLYILETVPTHDTEYNEKKGLHRKM